MLELIGRQISSSTMRKDLDSVADRTSTHLRSCTRQVCSLFSVLEDFRRGRRGRPHLLTLHVVLIELSDGIHVAHVQYENLRRLYRIVEETQNGRLVDHIRTLYGLDDGLALSVIVVGLFDHWAHGVLCPCLTQIPLSLHRLLEID